MTEQQGFHAGELAVQRRAGVQEDAVRLAGMLEAADLRGGIGRFLAEQTFLVLTARDRAGRLWTTALSGDPGFLRVRGTTELQVHAVPRAGDPLADLAPGQPVGVLVLDAAHRRRARINGTLTAVRDGVLTVEAEQAYGNCPRFIHPRDLEPTAAPATAVRTGTALAPADGDLIARADTFLLGTVHPTRGADASHRGGPAGLVRVTDETTLWWPDFPGNNMFNSLGNLAVDPEAALLFLDFATGETLHLSGRAELEWTTGSDVDGGTGRRVRFTVEAVVAGPSVALREAA